MVAKKSQKKEKEKEKKLKLRAEQENRQKEVTKSINRDIEIFSMSEDRIDDKKAFALWKGDKRNVAVYLQNFINYNKDALAFLDIDCRMSTTNLAIVLTASQRVGCAPLISPVTGKPCGNIRVKVNPHDDIDGVIPLIHGDIDLEYRKDLRLNKSPFAHPPIYLECIRFIEEYSQLDLTRWKKFSNLYKVQNQLSSSTDWGKYALRSFDPNSRLSYPNKINQLIIEHPEWIELMYVLSIAIAEVQSKTTPKSIRYNYSDSILHLKQKIPYQKIRPVKELKFHRSDPLAIQNIKGIGNNILKSTSSIACAWAFNVTKLYERYVQYLFNEVARKLGAQLFNNTKYPIKGQRSAWSLKYLEPDIIIKYGGEDLIIDAKYKTHMKNWNSYTDNLKDTFRSDLHQVLAYSTLSQAKEKKIILCYPANSVFHKNQILTSSFNNSRVKVYLLGIPINKNDVNKIIDHVYEMLTKDNFD